MKSFVTTLVLSIIFCLTTVAQPTITSGQVLAKIGEQFTQEVTAYVAPGDSGANVVWDFSSATSNGSSNVSYVDPSTTANGSSAPQANIALKSNGTVAYQKENSNASSIVAMDLPNGVFLDYNDFEDRLRFPLQYENAYNDPWKGTFKNQGMTYYRSGNTKVKVDGYGTIYTPIDTFQNVLRVHMVQTFEDSTGFVNFEYTNDQYFWYVAEIHYPVFTSFELSSFQGTSSSSYYLSDYPVSVGESPEKGVSFTTFPNPANALLHLTFNINQPTSGIIEICQLNGQVVLQHDVEFTAGTQTADVNVDHLARGLYMVRFTTATGAQTRKLIIE